MKANKFLTFLIISLSLAAFLTGYVLVERGTNTSSKTGTILDKFKDGTLAPAETQSRPSTEPVLLTTRRVMSATNSSNSDSIVYFDKDSGRLFEFNLENGSEQSITDRSIPNLLSAVWSPLKSAAVNLISSPSGIIFKHYDMSTGKEVSFDQGVHSVAFSPDGGLIAYFQSEDNPEEDLNNLDYIDRGHSGRIVLAQPDGSYKKTIFNTRLTDLKIYWPTIGKISFMTGLPEVFLVTEDGKLTKLLDQKLNLKLTWSPSGNKLLFSASSPENPSKQVLWLKDLVSDSEKSLAIEGDASLCAWSKDDVNIFCALAKSPSADEIYMIDTLTGSSKLITEAKAVASNLFLSATEDYLLFTSNLESKLYSIKIGN